MKHPKTPPPSLASVPIEDCDLSRHDKSRLPDITVKFDDEFSPSTATYAGNDSSPFSHPLVRHTAYNDQALDTFDAAIARAIELGFPLLAPLFPLGLPHLSSSFWDDFQQANQVIAPTLAEGSDDWLCVQCYMRLALASQHVNEGGKYWPLALAEDMFFAGAAARHLELSRRNRQDSLRGKVTAKSAAAGGKEKARATQERTREILSAMAEYVQRGRSVSEAAAFCHQKGIGASRDANRKLWGRYKK